MKTIKNELIALALISCILIAMIFIIHPLNEISIKDFSGLLGVLSYIVLKKMVDIYYEKKNQKKRTANNV